MKAKNKRLIGIWLLSGVLLIFLQVIIGGITRLTESGLSITEWEVVMGSLPPLNQEDWQAEFAKYQHSPQYQKVNKGMSLEEFKDIYFWEWFHRLYARGMGLVFIFPFFYFLFSGKFDREYLRKTLLIFGLGAVVGVFGWLMVASGLHDRPMVSPYRLALHLGLAILTLCYTLWIALELLSSREKQQQALSGLKSFSYVLTVAISLQILLGALVSGMRAAKFYPSWPDMNGSFIPSVLMKADNWHWQALTEFDSSIFPNALTQFLHRNWAYLLSLMIVVFLIRAFKQLRQNEIQISTTFKLSLLALPLILLLQLFLGIFTLINAIPDTPVALGVIHQAVAIILLANLLLINFKLSRQGSGPTV